MMRHHRLTLLFGCLVSVSFGALGALDDLSMRLAGRAVVLQLTLSSDCEACEVTRRKWDALESATTGSADVYVSRLWCDLEDERDLCEEILDSTAAPDSLPLVVFGGDAYSLKVWYGAKSEDALLKLARGLVPACSPSRPSTCSAAELKSVATFEALSRAELEALVATTELTHESNVAQIHQDLDNDYIEVEDALQGIERVYSRRIDSLVDKLQAMYAVADQRGVLIEVNESSLEFDDLEPEDDDDYASDFAHEAASEDAYADDDAYYYPEDDHDDADGGDYYAEEDEEGAGGSHADDGSQVDADYYI